MSRKTRARTEAILVVAGLFAVALAFVAWRFRLVRRISPASLASTAPAATVRLPSDERLRVIWGGDGKEANAHVTSPDQRWAYDLASETDGAQVLAPARGTVTLVRDGADDRASSSASPSEASASGADGNAVAIQLESGTYLVLAHLRKGSIDVRVGDHVEEGDVLGAFGSSGNVTEPHLHIHHQRQDPAANAFGVAEGLPLYFRDHDGAPMPERGARVRHVGDRRSSLPSPAPSPEIRVHDEPARTVDEAVAKRFGGTVPRSVVLHTVERSGGRGHVTLAVDGAKPSEAIVVASDAAGAVTWTRERPAAGITPPAGPMAIAAGDAGRVALAVCDPPTKRVALRLWDEDGSPFADFDVMDEEDCTALALLAWPKHGYVIVASRPGSTRAQLVSSSGLVAWKRGVDVGARTRDGAPTALAADTDDTFVLAQAGATSGDPSAAPHALAFRYDATSVPLWAAPVDLGAPRRATDAIVLTRVRPGVLRARIGNGSDVELGSDGVVRRDRRP